MLRIKVLVEGKILAVNHPISPSPLKILTMYGSVYSSVSLDGFTVLKYKRFNIKFYIILHADQSKKCMYKHLV